MAALLAVLAVIAGACSLRPLGSSSSTQAKVMDLFAVSPTTADATALLGSGTWFTGAPTFEVRPLDDATFPTGVQYEVVRRYLSVGTAQLWRVRYIQYDSSTTATSVMTANQTSFGTSSTGKKVGDQVVYVTKKVGNTTDQGAPYETLTLIRVGSVLVESIWLKNDGFPSSDKQGNLASKLASGVTNALAGKVHGTQVSTNDLATLPPPNPYITLLGAVKLPIEAVSVMLNVTAPTALVDALRTQGVNDFVFGDYVLDTDTHMEVLAASMAFPSANQASQVFNAFKGKESLDPNGVLTFYNDGAGQYEYFIQSGTHIGLLICKSTAELDAREAASRACETPLETVATAWPIALSG
jgi:hypothetical protein